MQIIPVIDLLDGSVVHARRGERHLYKPIQSVQCKTSQPLDVVQGLMKLYAFEQLYIADLNAIQKRGNHNDTIIDIQTAHPSLEIWLDCGIGQVHELAQWQGRGLQLVIGSENVHSLQSYLELQKSVHERHILSLDFFADEFRGPSDLLTQTTLWPEQVIAMTLTRVGSNAGPDIEKLRPLVQQKLQQGRPGCRLYAAGGVRNPSDLMALKQAGIDGVLIASALHSGALQGSQIAEAAAL